MLLIIQPKKQLNQQHKIAQIRSKIILIINLIQMK